MNRPINPRHSGPLYWIIAALFAGMALQITAWGILLFGQRFWPACVIAGVIVFCQYPYSYVWLVRKAVQGVK